MYCWQNSSFGCGHIACWHHRSFAAGLRGRSHSLLLPALEAGAHLSALRTLKFNNMHFSLFFLSLPQYFSIFSIRRLGARAEASDPCARSWYSPAQPQARPHWMLNTRACTSGATRSPPSSRALPPSARSPSARPLPRPFLMLQPTEFRWCHHFSKSVAHESSQLICRLLVYVCLSLILHELTFASHKSCSCTIIRITRQPLLNKIKNCIQSNRFQDSRIEQGWGRAAKPPTVNYS